MPFARCQSSDVKRYHNGKPLMLCKGLTTIDKRDETARQGIEA